MMPMPNDPIVRWENEGGAVLPIPGAGGRQLRRAEAGIEGAGSSSVPDSATPTSTTGSASPSSQQDSPTRRAGEASHEHREASRRARRG